MKSYFAIALLSLWLHWTAAFVPTPMPQRTVTFKPARKISGLKPSYSKQTIVLRMSEEKDSKQEAAPKSGKAFYDDEVRGILFLAGPLE
jgi:hypothetical protein